MNELGDRFWREWGYFLVSLPSHTAHAPPFYIIQFLHKSMRKCAHRFWHISEKIQNKKKGGEEKGGGGGGGGGGRGEQKVRMDTSQNGQQQACPFLRS